MSFKNESEINIFLLKLKELSPTVPLKGNNKWCSSARKK